MATVEYYRLLNSAQVEEYLQTPNTDVRQSIICAVMNSTVIVHRSDIFFYDVLEKYFKKISPYSNNALDSLVAQFVGKSLTYMERDDPQAHAKFRSKFSKEYAKFQAFKTTSVTSYKMKLSLPEDVCFNLDPRGIHFQNGRFDLATGTFAVRGNPNFHDPSTLISEVLPYEYAPSDLETIQDLWNILRKTFSSDEDLNYVLFVFASALRGNVKDCSCLFHVGEGSTGKTTLMDFVECAFGPLYVQKLPSHVFDSRVTANRVLSEVRNTSRFLIVSELNSKKKDASVIKCVCDGKISTTKLFKGGAFEMPILGKLFCTSNNLIAFDEDDSGTERRVMYYIHRNRFTKKDEEVDNVSVFKAVKFEFETIPPAGKLAVFHLIASFATDSKVDEMESTPPPSSVVTSDTLLNISSFLDAYCVPEADATVSKIAILAKAKVHYGDKVEFSEDYIINKITKCPAPISIMYDASRVVNGTKGVFVNIKLKD